MPFSFQQGLLSSGAVGLVWEKYEHGGLEHLVLVFLVFDRCRGR